MSEQEFRMNPGAPLDFRANVLLAISLICGKCLVTQWMPLVSACHESERVCVQGESRERANEPADKTDRYLDLARLLKNRISVDPVLSLLLSPLISIPNRDLRSC